MNHDQGSSQKAAGGVPSLPSVLAPLAGYRYAKSVGDRELMKTEAMKFKGKLYDERVKTTEAHNKEIRGLEAKVSEAKLNEAVAKGVFEATSKIKDANMSAILSQRNSLAKSLIDKGIELEVIKGVGSEYVRAIRGMEKLHGKKFSDLTPEEQDIWSRRATKQSLMTHQALIARSATTTGGVVGSQQNVDDLAAGEDTRPKPLSAPTNPDAAIVNKKIADGNLEGAEEYMRKQQEIKASGSRTAKTGLDNTGQKRIGEIVRNNIVSAIQIPEKIDVNNALDKTSGALPTDAELSELTRGLVDSLDVKRTLPANMLNIVSEIQSQAQSGLRILQGESPTPILDRDSEGRIVFHRDTSIEDRVKARQHAAIVAYFDSAQGQAFKAWLTESATTGAYKTFFLSPPSASGAGAPSSGWSGDTLDDTGGGGAPGGQRTTTPRQQQSSPGPKPPGFRPGMKPEPQTEIVEGSDVYNTIASGTGLGKHDWAQLRGKFYRVLDFWKTDNPRVPFMVRFRVYTKQIRRGKMRYVTSYEWLNYNQLGDLQRTNMPEDIRAMIESNQIP